jgi:hypothetical protein
MKERLNAKDERERSVINSIQNKENTHNNLDHHTPIRTMKPRASKCINQLRNDSRYEKHRHPHRTQVGKDARGGENDQAVCQDKGEISR